MSPSVRLFEKTCIATRVVTSSTWGEAQGPLLGSILFFEGITFVQSQVRSDSQHSQAHHTVTVSAYGNLWIILSWYFGSFLLW